jgi:hypothetical protein
MRNYPQEIEEKAILLSNITLERDAARESLNAVEDRIAFQIIMEKDASGKPAHSNDTLRGIAIRAECASSDEHGDLKASVERLEVLRVEATVRLERVRNEFSQWKIQERARIAELEAESQ